MDPSLDFSKISKNLYFLLYWVDMEKYIFFEIQPYKIVSYYFEIIWIFLENLTR